MNAIKNYATIHLQLNQIDGLEVAILLYDLSIKVCVPNKTKDLNISIFNMITGVNESKIKKKKKKHISCECECKFDRRKCNSN